ncbi:MAG: voltage-gated chloride channel protein, partial [Lactococcus plantarum]|nr:voltage-gated chloride channel protein [Lactococcus plantarum]
MFQTYKPILVWSVLAILIGIIVGALDALFGRVLLALSNFRTENFLYLIPFLAIAGIITVYIYQ